MSIRLVFSTSGRSPSGLILDSPRHEVFHGSCLVSRTVVLKTEAGNRDVTALLLDGSQVAVNRGSSERVEWYVKNQWLADAGFTVDTLSYTVEGRELAQGEGRCVFCGLRGHVKGKKNVSTVLASLDGKRLRQNIVCRRPDCQGLAGMEFAACHSHRPMLFFVGKECPMCCMLRTVATGKSSP